MRGDAGYPVKRAGVIGDAYKALQAVCAQTLEAEAKVAAKLKREEDKRRKEEEARAPPPPAPLLDVPPPPCCPRRDWRQPPPAACSSVRVMRGGLGGLSHGSGGPKP